MRYPTRRKSPFRHKVRDHYRSGRPVSRYWRGKGDKPRPRLVKVFHPHVGNSSPTDYNVEIKYSSSSENLFVVANDVLSAMDKALQMRSRIESPTSIILRR